LKLPAEKSRCPNGKSTSEDFEGSAGRAGAKTDGPNSKFCSRLSSEILESTSVGWWTLERRQRTIAEPEAESHVTLGVVHKSEVNSENGLGSHAGAELNKQTHTP